MNSEKIIASYPLDNGLTLEVWDLSRPVAGDRWLVVLEGRVKVPVNAETIPPDLKPQADKLTAALGQEIIHSQKDERNFIAAPEAPGLLKEMEARLLELAPGYLGHPEFAARLIRRRYAIWQEQQPRS